MSSAVLDTTMPVETPTLPQDASGQEAGSNSQGEGSDEPAMTPEEAMELLRKGLAELKEGNAKDKEAWKVDYRRARQLTQARPLILQKYASRCRELADVGLTSDEFIARMFPNEYIWIGEPHMTGEKYADNFDYVSEIKARYPFICPNPLKPGCTDRKAENVARMGYLVLESDTLDKEQTRVMFEFVEEYFNLQLKAIVFSGNKSLHGWFEHPGQAWLDGNKKSLEALGFDTACTRPAQPVRLPGVTREDTGKPQTLLWFKTEPSTTLCESKEGDKPTSGAKSNGTENGVPNGHGENPDNVQTIIDRSKMAKLHWDDTLSRSGFKNDKFYYYRPEKKKLSPYSEKNYRTILEGCGFFGHIDGENESEVKARKAKYFEELKCTIFAEREPKAFVEFGGWQAGFHTYKGDLYAVTGGTEIIEPKPGDFSFIETFGRELYGEEQYPYVKAWLKLSYESLRNGDARCGQTLITVGDPGVGKSLYKLTVLRPILGGRWADPTKFLRGDTTFNKDLVRAESWEIDDSTGAIDPRNGWKLMEGIKKYTVQNAMPLEVKGVDVEITPPFFKRITVSMNANPESLALLPGLRKDIADKVIIVKAVKPVSIKLPTNGEEETAFFRKVEEQLPAFCDHLLKWEIPAEIRQGRFDVQAYHDKEIVEKLQEAGPEQDLIDLIDILKNSGGRKVKWAERWEGTASELLHELKALSDCHGRRRDLDNVLQNKDRYFSNLLRKLSDRQNPRVVKRDRGNSGKRGWIIYPENHEPGSKHATAENQVDIDFTNPNWRGGLE